MCATQVCTVASGLVARIDSGGPATTASTDAMSIAAATAAKERLPRRFEQMLKAPFLPVQFLSVRFRVLTAPSDCWREVRGPRGARRSLFYP